MVRAIVGSMILAGVAQDGGFDPGTLLERLPYARPDARVHYTGSIDKKGGSADWTWALYQDAKGEFYRFFPMPYWQSAQVSVLNRATDTAAQVSFEIRRKPLSALAYPPGQALHFRVCSLKFS